MQTLKYLQKFIPKSFINIYSHHKYRFGATRSLENSWIIHLEFLSPFNGPFLKLYPFAIKYIPPPLQTQEMAYIILENLDRSLLKYINPKNIDTVLLKKYPYLIEYIPWKYQTKDMVDIILRKNDSSLLCFINPKFLEKCPTKDIVIKKFLKRYSYFPRIIKYIPFKAQNINMVTTVFLTNNSLVQFIAPSLRTDEMKNYSINLFRKSKKLNDLEGTIMTGEEFNNLMGNKFTFVKMMKRNEIHNGLQLKEGLNEDPNIFYPDCNSCPGGIYFVDELEVMRWLDIFEGWYRHSRKVTIPCNATIKFERNKIKTTCIILGEIDCFFV